MGGTVMYAEESHPDDEAILSHLIACDQALAAGIPLRQPTDAETPMEWLPRLQGDLACIQALRQVLSPRATVKRPVLTPELPFQQLGRFQIRRRLGEGAFGIVFLADDPQLGREVALKVPRPEALLTGELRERFVREARAAAGLDHPNLVPVYEAGAVGPICYIASAYCSGITLSEWLKERAELPQERLVASLVATLADAVAHAHTRGVIHRDLKPSNVLLQGKRRDPGGVNSTVKEPGAGRDSADVDWDFVPRITDFGLAKLTADAPSQPGDAGDAQTRSGAVLGTPNYMAPEQASGKNKEIGPAADVYALGVILYELLTGRPPFRGETILDTLEQVRTREPLPPGRLRPKLSRDLDTICLKCLQKEPRKRYESAAALADDFRRYLTGEPIQARPIRAWERGLKWAQRRPALAALLVVSVLGPILLATVVLAYDTQLRQSNKDLKDALDAKEEQRQEANDHFRLARRAIDDYVTKVSKDKRLRAHDLEGLRKELLQLTLNYYQDFVKKRSDDPDVQDERGGAILRLAHLKRGIGSKQEALKSFQEAVDVFRNLVREHPEVHKYQFTLSEALNDVAVVYLDLRQSDLAELAMNEALNIRKQLLLEHPMIPGYKAGLATIHNNLAVLYRESDRPELAEVAHRKALELREGLTHDHPAVLDYKSNLASSHFNLGLLYDETSRLELAENSYYKARDLARELVSKNSEFPDYQDILGAVLTNLGFLYRNTDRKNQALKAYNEVKGIYQQLTVVHPTIPEYQKNLAHVLLNLGQVCMDLHQPDRAEAAFHEACALLERLVGTHPKMPDYQYDFSCVQHNLGVLYCETGQPEKATVPFRTAFEIRGKLVHDYPSETDFKLKLGDTYTSMAWMESLQGNYQSSLALSDKSVQLLEAILKQAPQHPDARQYLQDSYDRRATTLNRLGRYGDTLRDLDRLLELGGAKNNAWRLLRAESLSRMGLPGPAMTEVNALADQPSISSNDLYNLACVCALCSAAVRRDTQLNKAEQDRLADKYAARAVEFLKRVKAAGFFKSAAARENMQKDKDLDALRRRQDFQSLFLSLEPKNQPTGPP
jgi:serine/threonine protein kinase